MQHIEVLRSTFESQVVLKKTTTEMGFWCPLSYLRKSSHKILSYVMKRCGWIGIRKKLSFHIIAP